jgi:hypothetical protein
MLTNTLLLYMTQEALAKARARLTPRKGEERDDHQHDTPTNQPAWQVAQRNAARKLRATLRH